MKSRLAKGKAVAGDDIVRDPEIRAALLRRLREQGALNDRTTVVVEELGLRRGNAILDVAVVNGVLSGFEIKSDADTLRRLAKQAAIYNQVLDHVTLVVGQQHLAAARELIPSWWGLMSVRNENGTLTLTTNRKPRANPARDVRALVELLWRDDAQRLLAKKRALDGLRTKRRRLLWERLCEVCSVDEISSEVRQRLKSRAKTGLLRRLS